MIRAAAFFMVCLIACTGVLGGEISDRDADIWKKCNSGVVRLKIDSDYDAARSLLRSYLALHGGSRFAEKARKELNAIQPYAEKQITGLFQSALGASQKGEFEIAVGIYTEIVTRAPSTEWVAKAREGMERNDKATGPLFASVQKQCAKDFDAWQFSKARGVSEKIKAVVVGTRWAEPAEAVTRELQLVEHLFKSLGSKVEKTRNSPRKTPFKIKDLSGWWVRGEISGITEQELMCLANGAGKTYTWEKLLPAGSKEPPDKFLQILDLYELDTTENLGLAILLQRKGYKAAAIKRFKIAEKDATYGMLASQYLAVLTGNLNRVAYDFSSGLQLMDWRAAGGRWRIVKGELAQESVAGESELTLSKHKYHAKEIRLFYEMTSTANKGLVSIMFEQDARNSFGFVFSPVQGFSAFATVDGRVKNVKQTNFRLPRGKKVMVRCGLKGNTFALSVGKEKLPRLTVDGLSSMEGHFRLRTLDSKARFDNIVIRNTSK